MKSRYWFNLCDEQLSKISLLKTWWIVFSIGEMQSALRGRSAQSGATRQTGGVRWLDRQTPGWSRFQIVFVKFLNCFMFITSRWFLFLCDIVCWCEWSCSSLTCTRIWEFLCCSCASVAWGHKSIDGDGLGLGLREVEFHTVCRMLRLENNARGGEGFHMAYTWCCVRMERWVKFGLESKFGKIGVRNCMRMLFP